MVLSCRVYVCVGRNLEREVNVSTYTMLKKRHEGVFVNSSHHKNINKNGKEIVVCLGWWLEM